MPVGDFTLRGKNAKFGNQKTPLGNQNRALPGTEKYAFESNPWLKSAQEIMEHVKRLNQPLNFIEPTQGDGNCFFEAVVQVVSSPKYQSTLSENAKISCKNNISLRQAVVNFVDKIYVSNNDSEEYTHFKISIDEYIEQKRDKDINEKHTDAWNRLKNYMNTPRVFADDLFIQFTAIYLEHDIKLISIRIVKMILLQLCPEISAMKAKKQFS